MSLLNNNSGNATVTFDFNTTASSAGWTAVVAEPFQRRCATDGHLMSDEVVLDDGGITGMCERCGEMIHGRRLAGGMGLQRLRHALVEQALDGNVRLVAAEFLSLADEIDAEERALHEAKSLLRLAERVLLARRDRVPA